MQEENILWIKEKTKITYSCDIEIELIKRDEYEINTNEISNNINLFLFEIRMKGSDENEEIDGLGTWKRHNC